jgi:hypothetical protein
VVFTIYPELSVLHLSVFAEILPSRTALSVEFTVYPELSAFYLSVFVELFNNLWLAHLVTPSVKWTP